MIVRIYWLKWPIVRENSHGRPNQPRRESFNGDSNLSVICDDCLGLSTRYCAENLPDRFFRAHDEPTRNGILRRRVEVAIISHTSDITVDESWANQRHLHA